MFGICNLSIVAIRKESSESSEMINQLLFGEYFEIIEKDKFWSKIRTSKDDFEGYVSNLQYQIISDDYFKQLEQSKQVYSLEFIDFICSEENVLTTIPIGSNLPLFDNGKLNFINKLFTYEGRTVNEKQPKYVIIEMALLFLNTPYLKGGVSSFGIDASSFIQLVYRLSGYQLFRDTKRQSSQGETLSFIEESEAGDLAFFDDTEGNINHVGIILNDHKIIHSYGHVRIDQLDHFGIYNKDTKTHTHKLRTLKRIV